MKINHGFTLIELIVTVAMIGILAATAGPELIDFMKRNKGTTHTNHFVRSLNVARSEAAKRVSSVTMCIGNTAQNACVAAGTTWEDGWIVFVDSNSDGVIDAGERIIIVNNEITGDTTIRSTQHVSNITYLGDGSTSTAGTFRVCDSFGVNRAKAINVMGSGLISQGKDTDIDADTIVQDFQGNNITCP